MAIISGKMIGLLQKRIQHEEANSKKYAAMSNWLNLNGFLGASKLWKTYSEDELVHKSWTVQYLLDLNILPIEPPEEQVQTEFKGLANIIALSYQVEIDTTNEVKELGSVCLDEVDLLTFGLAQKYIAEQVEEISKIQSLIDKLESFGTDKIALKLLDQEMGV
jgi:ferritin